MAAPGTPSRPLPPSAAMMWLARHRWPVRVICIAVVLTCVGLTIEAGVTGAHATTIVLRVGITLIWCGLGIVYGVLYPSKVDAWEQSQTSPPHGG